MIIWYLQRCKQALIKKGFKKKKNKNNIEQYIHAKLD